jgi:hypothetical protein
MKITIPLKEIEVCDRCFREGYLQSCIVCGGKFCLTCEGIICGCAHKTRVCKPCADEPSVLEVVKKYVPRLVRIIAARDAELAGIGAAVKKARRARKTKAPNAKRQDGSGEEGAA